MGRDPTGKCQSLGMPWRQADSGGKDQHSIEENMMSGWVEEVACETDGLLAAGEGRVSCSRDQEEDHQCSLAGTKADKMRKISIYEVLRWGMRSLKALSWPGTSSLTYVAVVCM